MKESWPWQSDLLGFYWCGSAALRSLTPNLLYNPLSDVSDRLSWPQMQFVRFPPG